MATFETKINNFSGGIVNNARSRRTSIARMVTNFNIFDSPRLTPYRKSEDGDDNSSTSHKQNFAIALRTGTTYSLYSLGVKSGAATAEVLYKDLLITGSNNLSDDGWNSPSNNQSPSGSTKFELFVYYKKAGLIYGARNNAIWAFSPTGSAFANSERSLTHTNIAQGLVHSKDDILYIPYDNKIAKNNNGSWTDVAIEIPSFLKINSICEFGNYLAIGATPLSGVGNSRVYLWDRDSSLTTLSENIDWGSGELKILEEVLGRLVGISVKGGSDKEFGGARVIFRFLSGGISTKYTELVTDNNTILLPIAKQKLDNRVYFTMSATINGELREGVWSFGRSLLQDNFTIVHERTPNNDTALTTGIMKGVFVVGSFMFISYVDNNVFKVSKTNDTASFTASSIYESKIYATQDSSLKKSLVGITVTTQPQPTNGQHILKYAVDENIGTNSWTTIFTEATDDSISKSAVDSLPKDYKEIQFRLESTGGTEITGCSFKEEVTGKRNYD